MLKRFLFLSIIIFIVCVILNSCVISDTNKAANKSYKLRIDYTGREKLECIIQHPTDENSFIGVSSSNTEEKQFDHRSRKRNAIVALSSDTASNYRNL